MYINQLLRFIINRNVIVIRYVTHRDISTLSGVLMLVAQDLHKGYYEGFNCEDYSLPLASPLRHFQCKVCLLYITGDYPALAKMTGFTHQGSFCCHWCMIQTPKDMAINRQDVGGFRRWLPPLSRHRAAGGNFDHPEMRPPPALREHHETVRVGVSASSYTGPNKFHPGKTHGIVDWCPLSVHPNFDMVADSPGDLMHGALYYPHHVVKAMKGTTELGRPTLLKIQKTKKNETETKKQTRLEENDRRLEENERRQRDNAKAREV